MTLCITAVALMVTVAAAVRSTWSPCGLSMMSTITPISERAKGHSYTTTATWFVLGATAGGMTVGVAMALAADGARSLHLGSAALGLLALGAALIAAGSDLGVGGRKLPIHRRQVNERWLDHYRPWVYGAGFGWQIGTGLATYITTAAVYLMIVLGALTTRPMVALALGTGFGLLRGLAVFLTRPIASTTELLAFHRRVADAGPMADKVVIGVEAGGAVVLAASLRSTAALALVGCAAGVTVAATIMAKGRVPAGPAGDGTDTDRSVEAVGVNPT